MPDLDLNTTDGPTRVYQHLHDARPLFINFADPATFATIPWPAHLKHLTATTNSPWLLPVLGEVPPPIAVLIRPDGHVAWVGQGTTDGLTDSLSEWFGSAVAAPTELRS
jgi:3-(3-hydroxy-phenyl)propionate hydroxylase